MPTNIVKFETLFIEVPFIELQYNSAIPPTTADDYPSKQIISNICFPINQIKRFVKQSNGGVIVCLESSSESPCQIIPVVSYDDFKRTIENVFAGKAQYLTVIPVNQNFLPDELKTITPEPIPEPIKTTNKTPDLLKTPAEIVAIQQENERIAQQAEAMAIKIEEDRRKQEAF